MSWEVLLFSLVVRSFLLLQEGSFIVLKILLGEISPTFLNAIVWL